MIGTIALIIYLLASLGLLIYGLNCYVLLHLFSRKSRESRSRQLLTEKAWNRAHPHMEISGLPRVTTQLPMFNELNVAERVIRAIAAFDYPAHLHQIQILDDSTDETSALIDRTVAALRPSGIRIDVIRRPDRTGYKAGALANALPSAAGDYITIFDSDFAPAPDFIRKLLPHFENPQTGLVQARWGHLNRTDSLLTRAQSIGIDGHFAIEQTARASNGLFLNFNGTAGIWRKSCIEDAGGWIADTLTEDLDLSYRAQLRGWLIEYVPDVVVPAELPETYSAFKSQQFRWAKGSIQTAIKLLPAVLTSSESALTKIQSIFHLCAYLAHPLMLAVALFALPALHFLGNSIPPVWLAVFAIPLIAATLGPSLLYTVSQRVTHPADWKTRMLALPALILLGFGICISNTRAVLEALLNVRSPFIRTPKRGSARPGTYRSAHSLIPFLEILAAIYCAITLYHYARSGVPGIIPFLTLYIAGFSLVGISSLREQFNDRKA